jgi:hypothetical protein
VDLFGGKSLPVEIETNRALIHCAVRSALTSDSAFYTKKPPLLDRKSKCEHFVFVKCVHMAWTLKCYS